MYIIEIRKEKFNEVNHLNSSLQFDYKVVERERLFETMTINFHNFIEP